MNADRSEPENRPRARTLRLRRQGRRMRLFPPLDSPHKAAAASLHLPRLPLCFVHVCAAIGAVVWKKQRVRIALALMLDTERRSWTWPVIPTQHGTRQQARWSLLPGDFADLDAPVVVAGSYQTLGAGHKDLLELLDCVPDFDGVHLIEVLSGHRPLASWVVVRAEGQPVVTDPSAVFVDQAQSILRRYRDRLSAD